METLILKVLGKELDWTKELEIFSSEIEGASYGLKATLEYKNGTSEVRNNLTEFHHRYDSERPYLSKDSVDRILEEEKIPYKDWVIIQKEGDFRGPTKYSYTESFSSAFESDHHSTGGTVHLWKLKSIVVEKQDKLESSY